MGGSMTLSPDVVDLLGDLGRAGVTLAPHPEPGRVRHRPATLSPDLAKRLRLHRGEVRAALDGCDHPGVPGTPAWLIKAGAAMRSLLPDAANQAPDDPPDPSALQSPTPIEPRRETRHMQWLRRWTYSHGTPIASIQEQARRDGLAWSNVAAAARTLGMETVKVGSERPIACWMLPQRAAERQSVVMSPCKAAEGIDDGPLNPARNDADSTDSITTHRRDKTPTTRENQTLNRGMRVTSGAAGRRDVDRLLQGGGPIHA